MEIHVQILVVLAAVLVVKKAVPVDAKAVVLAVMDVQVVAKEIVGLIAAVYAMLLAERRALEYVAADVVQHVVEITVCIHVA